MHEKDYVAGENVWHVRAKKDFKVGPKELVRQPKGDAESHESPK
jgi:hypothetical protein